LHEIFDLGLRVGYRCPSETPWWAADQAGDAHQTSDALAGDSLFASAQVSVDSRRAVRAVAVFVNGPDLFC
jgi:hypothetical protein